MLDLAVIGAGPCGLAVGVAAKRARLTCSLFDQGPVASSLMRYPLYMTFFSTPDKLEIGVPFVTAGDKPTRREALTYYRKVAEHFELDVRQYHTVSRVTRAPDGFELVAHHAGSPEPETIRSRHLVFATGYFESPNPLRVPDGDREMIPADFVLALTGYTADLTLLRSVGVSVDDASGVPQHAPDTMETNVRGVYIAGVLASGFDANKIFIENGREHGGRICDHIKSKPPRGNSGGFEIGRAHV